MQYWHQSGQLVFVNLERVWRWNFAFVCADLVATESYQFQDDSETTVYQLKVGHIEISGIRLARHEMRALDTIQVRPAAIRCSIANTFRLESILRPWLPVPEKAFE